MPANRAWRSADCLRDHVHGRPGGYTLDYLFGHLPMERRRILKQRVDALEEGADCPLLPGVAAVIRQLRWLDVPLALVTSSWPARIDHVLRQHDLQAAFRTLVSRDDVVHGKPAPDGYRLAAARLGVAPSRCLVFEDSLSGVQAACAAGATCVAIGEESGLLAAGARWSVRDFRELRIVREDDRLYCQHRHPATTGSERWRPMSPTLQDARLLWDFLGQGRCHVPCELLVVCGSYDLRVCDHACELLERGLAERLLFTGNTGHWTRHLWVEPEAELFARHARARGVSDSLIVIEPRATNFAENIAFARELFPDLRRATFVTKPNSIRRVALTLPVRWPGLEGHVDAPDYAFPDGISNLVGVLGVIDEMVGDLDRIMRYPALGFQVACPIPAQVMDAWERLVARGFDRHLVNPPR